MDSILILILRLDFWAVDLTITKDQKKQERKEKLESSIDWSIEEVEFSSFVTKHPFIRCIEKV